MGKADHRLLTAMLGGTSAARQTADCLLRRWPSLPTLLSADERAIAEVGGAAAATLCVTAWAVIGHVNRHAIEDRPLLSSSAELASYLRHVMAYKTSEELRVLFLNAGNRLVSDEVIAKGSADRVVFEPKEILRRAIELRATALIVAHNHPGGCPRPSRHDIEATGQLIALAQHFTIEVHDHIIVTRGGQTSLRALGLIGKH